MEHKIQTSRPYRATTNNELSIYIHWPFCTSKCPYCDFNSHVERSITSSEWSIALETEIANGANWLGQREISSIFFGGGTPSLMDPIIVGNIINAISRKWQIQENAEITLEANPGSSESSKFRDFCTAGINRLSLGVQSLNDHHLKFLGRHHTARQARRAVDIGRQIFPRFSMDLIYSLPGQSSKSWRDSLCEVLQMCGDHLSLYQLTIEKGTPFYSMARKGEFLLPDENQATALYNLTQETLDTGGFPAYEISNHAAPGNQSKHNLSYWLYKDYLGVGPGAHSRVTIDHQVHALSQVRAPRKWFESKGNQPVQIRGGRALTLIECVREMVMMGLRLTDGINKERFKARLNSPLNGFLDSEVLSELIRTRLVIDDPVSLRLTSAGRFLINPITERLIP